MQFSAYRQVDLILDFGEVSVSYTHLDYPQLFWNKWAKGEKYVLPPSLLLGGREDAINAIKVSDVYKRQVYFAAVSLHGELMAQWSLMVSFSAEHWSVLRAISVSYTHL